MNQVPLRLKWLLKSKKETNHQVLIKFQQNLFKAGGRTICSEILKLIYSIWKEELPEQWKELIIVSVRGVVKQIVIIIETYHFCQVLTKFYPSSSNITPYVREIIGGCQCGFLCTRSATDLIFFICQILQKKKKSE